MREKILVVSLLVVCAFAWQGCKQKKTEKEKSEAGQAAAENAANKNDARCPEGMAYVPAGEFTMGCVNDSACFQDEKSPGKVKLSAYCIDKTEVTQEQYRKVMNENPSGFKNCGNSCPVDQITWSRASGYCNRISKKLPTEAQWEKAARAGTETRYYWGNADFSDYGWFDENSGRKPHPVGQKKPNAFGLYDMLGNASEWTADCYDPTKYSSMSKSDPVYDSPGCPLRVMRGGSWSGSVKIYSSSDRSGFSPDIISSFIGFRCAAEPKAK